MIWIGVMVAGALGALSRYLLSSWIQSGLVGSLAGFPLGTLVINVAGSFLLSFLTQIGLRGLISPALRISLGIGFVGAFTTFSTFELDSSALLGSGEWSRAALYILGNLLLGYLAVWLGRAAAVTMVGP
jgi:CrcB protein